jgi:integrase
VGEIRRDKGTGGKPIRRSDGRFTAQWTDLAGRRRYVYGRTEKECERKRDDAIRLANAGVEPSVLTLAAYLERYLARRMNLDEESRERYERLLRLHVRKSEAIDDRGRRIADKAIARLTTDDVEALYLERSVHLAPKTIGLLHTFLHTALAQAATRGKIVRNPADGAERPSIHRTTPAVLDGAGLRALMDAAEGNESEAFVAVVATTGLRHGEILDLRWAAVDWERGCLVLANPEKGGVPRSIPVPPRTIRSLRTQKARVAEIRLRRAGAWQDEDRVFPGTWGEAADRSSSGDRLADVAKSAGLGHVTVRQLRHSVATELLRQGIPMKVVQEVLGHRSMRQTSDTYSHVSESLMASAMAAMARVVGE